jgi:hypothetical protein
VLIGQVRQRGETFVVQQQGATLHLAAYQVQAVCDDVVAAYEYKREALNPSDAMSHLRLAEWCIRQDLLEEAGNELGQARLLAPDHPRVAIVGRRLAVVRRPASTPTSGDSNPSKQGTPDLTAGVPTASGDALDAQLAVPAGLPDDTMEQFRRTIQPLLLNTCTTSGCHREGAGQSLVLDRQALWRDASHTLSAENLSGTLANINREAPLASPLLVAAASPHATLASPPLAMESESFARLKEWVLHVCGHDQPPQVTDEEVADSSEATGEIAEEVISDEELDALLAEEYEKRSHGQPTIQRGLRPVPRRQPDPYDPEEFNRHFGTRDREQ